MANRSSTRLTQTVVSQLTPEISGEYTVFDAELPGFGIRVRPGGAKTFVVKYRNAYGRQRKLTLGRYGALTVMQARKEALAHLGEISRGEDPAENRDAKRQALTVAELCDRYLADAGAGKVLYRGKAKQANTVYMDHGRVKRHIKPLVGNRAAKDLQRSEVERMMFDIRDGKTAALIKTGPRGVARVRGGQGTAVMAVKLLSAMFNYGTRQGWVEHNPAWGIQKPVDRKRDRFLTPDEYSRLGKALVIAGEQGINHVALSAIVALALTGCRRGEILSLQRDSVDTVGRGLRLAQTKTGPQVRPCGQAAFAHFTTILDSHNSSWAFPSPGRAGHLVNIRKPMLTVCEIANLENVTPHTLRHAYATVAHELGFSELTIAGLLGHSAGSVTSRYAHHVDYVLADAADRVSETIMTRLGT